MRPGKGEEKQKGHSLGGFKKALRVFFCRNT